MASSFLKVHHALRKIFRGITFALTVMTDLIILAKYAAKVAMREKNGTRSAGPAYGGFFSVVYTNGGNAKSRGRPAVPHIPGKTVDAAVSGAQGAVVHTVKQVLMCSFYQVLLVFDKRYYSQKFRSILSLYYNVQSGVSHNSKIIDRLLIERQMRREDIPEGKRIRLGLE